MDRNKNALGKPGRRIVGDLLIALVLLLAADVTVVMLHRIGSVVLKETYRTIFSYEMILCAVLMIFALDVRFDLVARLRSKAARGIGWIVRTAILLMTAGILFFCARVAAGSLLRTSEAADNAIVLGMALEDGQPTRDLILRIDTAQRYAEEYPDAVLILTGGNPDASGRTEAAVMRDLLLERGVPEKRMRLEDRAKTTKNNFENTAKMLSADETSVLITSDYHMDRALKTAKSAGFSHLLRCPAPSDPCTYGASMLWEVVMDLNELGKK